MPQWPDPPFPALVISITFSTGDGSSLVCETSIRSATLSSLYYYMYILLIEVHAIIYIEPKFEIGCFCFSNMLLPTAPMSKNFSSSMVHCNSMNSSRLEIEDLV